MDQELRRQAEATLDHYHGLSGGSIEADWRASAGRAEPPPGVGRQPRPTGPSPDRGRDRRPAGRHGRGLPGDGPSPDRLRPGHARSRSRPAWPSTAGGSTPCCSTCSPGRCAWIGSAAASPRGSRHPRRALRRRLGVDGGADPAGPPRGAGRARSRGARRGADPRHGGAPPGQGPDRAGLAGQPGRHRRRDVLVDAAAARISLLASGWSRTCSSGRSGGAGAWPWRSSPTASTTPGPGAPIG